MLNSMLIKLGMAQRGYSSISYLPAAARSYHAADVWSDVMQRRCVVEHDGMSWANEREQMGVSANGWCRLKRYQRYYVYRVRRG